MQSVVAPAHLDNAITINPTTDVVAVPSCHGLQFATGQHSVAPERGYALSSSSLAVVLVLLLAVTALFLAVLVFSVMARWPPGDLGLRFRLALGSLGLGGLGFYHVESLDSLGCLDVWLSVSL